MLLPLPVDLITSGTLALTHQMGQLFRPAAGKPACKVCEHADF
jgi:hypothetical protein